MNKIVSLLVVIIVAVVALGSAGIAYAQSPTGAPGTGIGNMGGRGAASGFSAGVAGTGDGILHDYFITAYAEQLNLTVDELQARLDSGETMSQIALSTGLTLDEFRLLAQEVRTQAIAQALADGVITQAQADWMSQRGFGNMGSRMGSGTGQMRGAGQGQFANPSCPNYTPALP
jgi:hypothetical protein